MGLLSVRGTASARGIVHCSKLKANVLSGAGHVPDCFGGSPVHNRSVSLGLHPGLLVRHPSMEPSSPSRHLLAPSAVARLRGLPFQACVSVRKLSMSCQCRCRAASRRPSRPASTLLSPLGYWAVSVSLGTGASIEGLTWHGPCRWLSCPVTRVRAHACRKFAVTEPKGKASSKLQTKLQTPHFCS